MSIDGPGILESDVAHDAYGLIIDLWDAGAAVDEIHRRLAPLEEFAQEPIDAECLLAACVKAFWEIGHLSPALRLDLRRRVDEGASLAQWAEGNAALAKRRLSVLERLLKQSETPKARPRSRRKNAAIRDKLYALGDCLAFVDGDRTYRGVVCMVSDKRGRCEYVVVAMHPRTRSTQRSFESGQYFGHRIGTPGGDIAGLHVIRLEHRTLLRADNPPRKVAHVELDTSRFMLGSFSGYTAIEAIAVDLERIQARGGFPGQRRLHPLAELLRDGSAA